MISKRKNIYPRNVENIKAILLYYFPKEKHTNIDLFSDKLYDERILALNEIEYISEFISKHFLIIEPYFKLKYVDSAMEVLFATCEKILFQEESEWNISKSGKDNLKALRIDLEKFL